MRLKLYRVEPAVEFFLGLNRRRHSLRSAFDAAMISHDQSSRADLDYLNAAFASELGGASSHSREQLAQMDALAETHDSSANILAAIVLLVLDDLLQKYASDLGIKEQGVALKYGETFDGVTLTEILAAAGNNFRHARTWDRVPWPYPDPGKDGRHKQALASIRPLAKVLHLIDPIRDYVTRSVLIVLARNVGTGQPHYDDIEHLVTEAALAIATHIGPDAAKIFEEGRVRVDEYLRAGQLHSLIPTIDVN